MFFNFQLSTLQTILTFNYLYFMRTIIQRVTSASVEINGKIKSSINNGILVLAGFEEEDSVDDISWMANKISQLRIFNDDNNIMNLSVKDIDGEILIISQFTLHAKTKKGNRPSYIKAATPEIAIPFYNEFVNQFEKLLNKEIKTGEFGAMMEVSLINSGPVTISIDSKNKE